MNRIALIATLATVAGCASGPASYRAADPNEAQCEYEADAATVNIPNPWTQAFEKNSLKAKCLNAKKAANN